MGIASGIFWIVFGLLYILYKAFREHPDETVLGILMFGIVGGGIIAWHFIFHALIDWNIYVATAFAAISFGALFWYFIKICRENRQERERRDNLKARALKIAREEPIDEKDLAEYERIYWKTYSYSSKNYSKEKLDYKMSNDKSKFRDLIIKDYIENHRVFVIMSLLEKEEQRAKEVEKREEN